MEVEERVNQRIDVMIRDNSRTIAIYNHAGVKEYVTLLLKRVEELGLHIDTLCVFDGTLECDTEILFMLTEFVQRHESIVCFRFPVGKAHRENRLGELLTCLHGNMALECLILDMPRDMVARLTIKVRSLIMQSRILKIKLVHSDMDYEKNWKINQKCRISAISRIPFDERDIPLKSNTKSAAKLS